jgi:hypothetical protein
MALLTYAAHRMARRLMLAVVVVGALVLLGITGFRYLPYDYTEWTCLHCRAMKSKTRKFGMAEMRIYDSEFTPWYRTHFPPHDHVWAWCGSEDTYTASGDPFIFRCGRQHPIFQISPAWQLRMAQQSPEKFQAFHRAMTSGDPQQVESAFRAAFSDTPYP